MLEDAGRIGIPFTTGILVGIGETVSERVDALFELRRIARTYGSVQEVIVQNFRAKDDTAMRNEPDLGVEEYLAHRRHRAVVLGPSVTLQAPPNLSDPSSIAPLLAAGVDDWGGVSPVTPDHVNPERPWPQIDDLASWTAESGLQLSERLTAHPRFVRETLAGERPWFDTRLVPHVSALAAS